MDEQIKHSRLKPSDYALITIIVCSLLIVYFVGQIIQNAYAQPTVIGIIPSKSCLRSTQCTSIEDLVKAYDNTNQYLSGKFDYDKFGDYRRMPSKFKNHWNFYQYSNQFLIAVDPDAKWQKHLNYQIIIEPSHFVYFDRAELKMDNQTLTQYHDRNVQGCRNAVVYYELLQDTLNYLLSHCQDTNYKEKQDIYFPLIPLNFSDHKWYSYTEWLKQAKQTCKAKC